MDTSTQFRLDTVDDAIAANADDPAALAKLIAYRAQILGNTDTGRPSRDVGELTTTKRRSDNGTNVGSRTSTDLMTARQRSFIAKLLAEREVSFPGYATMFSTFIERFRNETLGKRDASELIDWLNDQPVLATAPTRRPASEGQLRMVNVRRSEKGLRPLAETELFMDEVDEELAQIEAMPTREWKVTASAGELTDGMYRKDGEIYKVQVAVHGSGRLYAKRLVVTEFDDAPAEVSFEYATGAIRTLTLADRMTLEEAKAFGALYGTCCVCGRTLTDERSIEEGIGPVCAKRFA